MDTRHCMTVYSWNRQEAFFASPEELELARQVNTSALRSTGYVWHLDESVWLVLFDAMELLPEHDRRKINTMAILPDKLARLGSFVSFCHELEKHGIAITDELGSAHAFWFFSTSVNCRFDAYLPEALKHRFGAAKYAQVHPVFMARANAESDAEDTSRLANMCSLIEGMSLNVSKLGCELACGNALRFDAPVPVVARAAPPAVMCCASTKHTPGLVAEFALALELPLRMPESRINALFLMTRLRSPEKLVRHFFGSNRQLTEDALAHIERVKLSQGVTVACKQQERNAFYSFMRHVLAEQNVRHGFLHEKRQIRVTASRLVTMLGGDGANVAADGEELSLARVTTAWILCNLGEHHESYIEHYDFNPSGDWKQQVAAYRDREPISPQELGFIMAVFSRLTV
jgi:hypothetical protein